MMRIPNERAGKPEEDADLIDRETLFPRHSAPSARTGDEPGKGNRDPEESDDFPVPQITRMPEGITVIEQQIGHALGQWVFVIVCDCGRRWFSLHEQDTAQCPRCERWVQIDAEPRNPG